MEILKWLKQSEVKDKKQISQNKFKTYYEEKILQESNLNNCENFEFSSDIKSQNLFYQPKPEMQKFKIEGFNLNTLTNKNLLSMSLDKNHKTQKELFKEVTIEESDMKPHKELDFSNFKIAFDQSLKKTIFNFKKESEQHISEYIFKKMSILEYFHCLRSEFIFPDNFEIIKIQSFFFSGKRSHVPRFSFRTIQKSLIFFFDFIIIKNLDR